LGVRARAVSEDETAAVVSGGKMEEAADVGIDRVIGECADGGVRQALILNRELHLRAINQEFACLD